MADQELELSVLIVTWNSAPEIKDCLRSVVDCMAAEGISGEVIVIDNASSDATTEAVRSTEGPIRLIEAPANLGFARANNLGMSEATGRHILILNPDTIVDAHCLTRTIEAATQLKDAGVIGCQLYNASGIQRSYFWPHTLGADIARLTGVAPAVRTLRWALSEQTERKVGGVVGAFMLIPASILRQVGGFAEDIFMYGEDIDLCYRITSLGYSVYYVPSATCFHIHNASGSEDHVRYAKHFDAIRHFYRVHQGRARYIAFLCVLLLTYPLRRLALGIAGLLGSARPSRVTQERVYATEALDDLLCRRPDSPHALGRGAKLTVTLLGLAAIAALGISWPVQAIALLLGVVAYFAAAAMEPSLDKHRVDLLSPWVAFPSALILYYTIGLLLPLDYVGGQIPLGQVAYYVLGLGFYMLGVRASGARLTRPECPQTDHPSHRGFRTRAQWVTGIGLVACISVVDRFGARGADYGFRFAGAPGWLFYALFMLIAGLFGLVLLQMWRHKSQWVTVGIVALAALTSALTLAFGSRSPLFVGMLMALIAFHYVVRHLRPKQLVAVALVGLLAVTALGFFRAMGDPSRAQWYTRNSIQYGVPRSAMLFAPGLLALRNGPGHLEVIRHVYPSQVPYMNGWFSVMSMATLAPGTQPLPGHVLTKTLFDRPIEEMGGVAPGMLGGFYVDRGWLGIAIGMFIVGLSLGLIHRWMATRYSPLSVAVYSVVLANYLLWIYGNFMTNPIAVWLLVLVIGMFWSRPGRASHDQDDMHRQAMQ